MPDADTKIAIIGAGSRASPPRIASDIATARSSRRRTTTPVTCTRVRDGFTWDDGPHISFTTNEYVAQLFADLVDGEYEECRSAPANYYQGHWIEHPAQTHLYQVPEPLRTQCLASFLETAARRSCSRRELPGLARSGDGAGLRRDVSGGVHPQVLDVRAARTSTPTGSAYGC